mmetsp:Transcript_3765/g.9130  ORF Transcript_3765/g.9130 Transcript_3765/m.9130 type:complete len:286 (+) Transcript_3765:5824-6681(+)
MYACRRHSSASAKADSRPEALDAPAPAGTAPPPPGTDTTSRVEAILPSSAVSVFCSSRYREYCRAKLAFLPDTAGAGVENMLPELALGGASSVNSAIICRRAGVTSVVVAPVASIFRSPALVFASCSPRCIVLYFRFVSSVGCSPCPTTPLPSVLPPVVAPLPAAGPAPCPAPAGGGNKLLAGTLFSFAAFSIASLVARSAHCLCGSCRCSSGVMVSSTFPNFILECMLVFTRLKALAKEMRKSANTTEYAVAICNWIRACITRKITWITCAASFWCSTEVAAKV